MSLIKKKGGEISDKAMRNFIRELRTSRRLADNIRRQAERLSMLKRERR